MYEFLPYEKPAWGILGCLMIANATLLVFNIRANPKNNFIRACQRILSDQMGLLFVIALFLETVPLLSIYDMAIYAEQTAKQVLYFRVFRAIYVGVLGNLILLLLNRSIVSARRSMPDVTVNS